LNKSILFISYHFPPDAEVGAKRISRLAWFLHEKEWDVGVLTVKEKYYHQKDPSFFTMSLATYRTKMVESIRFLFGDVRGWGARLFHRSRNERRHSPSSSPSNRAPCTVETASARNENLFGAARRFCLSLIWCPDDRQGWIPFGLSKCLSLRRRYRILYSSSPPYTAAIIPFLASYVSRKYIWIAEFRDPWTGCYKPEFIVSSLSRWIEKRLEAAVVARCTRLVVVNDAMKKDFAERYPTSAGKIWVHYNGFDAERLAGVSAAKAWADSGKRVFLHTGSLYQGRDPSVFIAAVAELVRERKMDPEHLEIVFIGDSSVGDTPIQDIARRFGIEGMVRTMGYIPHDQCLVEMNNADVLLLFNINQPLQIPAKFYEYLGLRKHVLSLSTGGITDELIERTKIGLNVSPGDLESIKRAIVALLDAPAPAGDPDEIEKFKTTAIFEGLAADLEKLVEETGA
jgi:glycosyltransferase involved in cell wall biosynthesis